MKSTLPRVISETVSNNVCCGCGVCSGICTHNALSMQLNKYGEYNPTLTGTCVQCGLCDNVCPFLDGNPNEDEIANKLYSSVDKIKYESEIGYYLNSYVGCAPDHEMHWNGASGGLATWTLCKLLEEDQVDYIISIVPNQDSDMLFKHVVLSTTEEVMQCSKSAYYPTEIAGVLKHIQSNDGRYAIIGLPCVCKAIRLAQWQNTTLQSRIAIVLGLVCGQQKSKHYASHIAKLAGCPTPPVKVDFRNKENNTPSCNFTFKAWDTEGGVYAVKWLDGVSRVWCDSLYNLPSCFCCDDIYAECADVAFMDAWLPEYATKDKGTSLVVTRSSDLDSIYKRASDKRIISPTELANVTNSQLGVIRKKRHDLPRALYIENTFKNHIPTKRFGRKKPSLAEWCDIIGTKGRWFCLRRATATNGPLYFLWASVSMPFHAMQLFHKAIQRLLG